MPLIVSHKKRDMHECNTGDLQIKGVNDRACALQDSLKGAKTTSGLLVNRYDDRK